MKALIAFSFLGLFMALSINCYAQAGTVSAIQDQAGFYRVCSSAILFPKPRKQTEAQKLADESLCNGYLNGLIDGWRDGDGHGVLAAHFPGAFPADESKALRTLSAKEQHDVNAALETDMPCVPEQTTIDEIKDVVINYIKFQSMKVRPGQVPSAAPFIEKVPTSRVVKQALQDKFPCFADVALSDVTIP